MVTFPQKVVGARRICKRLKREQRRLVQAWLQEVGDQRR
jgi:hypothetical protein